LETTTMRKQMSLQGIAEAMLRSMLPLRQLAHNPNLIWLLHKYQKNHLSKSSEKRTLRS
jgi:hypothetical protein